MKFEYSYIDSEKDRTYIKMKTHEIHSMLPKSKRTRVSGDDFFAIGSILLDIRPKMKPRLFRAWIETELHMSRVVALRYMKVVEVFGDKYDLLRHLPYSTLYMLASHSCLPTFLEKMESSPSYIPSSIEIKTVRAASTHEKPEMTDAQSHAAALSDPDAQPLTKEDFARIKHTPQAKIIRRALEPTQEEFAARYHIPLDTLKAWEEGHCKPDQVASAYLDVIAMIPEDAARALQQKQEQRKSL